MALTDIDAVPAEPWAPDDPPRLQGQVRADWLALVDDVREDLERLLDGSGSAGLMRLHTSLRRLLRFERRWSAGLGDLVRDHERIRSLLNAVTWAGVGTVALRLPVTHLRRLVLRRLNS